MGKVRVYDLAKELGTTSKKLIEVMEEMNIGVKNHMSTLEDNEAQRVIAILTGQAEDKAQEEKAHEAQTVSSGKDSESIVVVKKEKKKPFDKTRGKTVQPAVRRVPKVSRNELEEKQRRRIKLEGRVTVGELASHLDLTASEIISQLLALGIVANINHGLSADTLELLADLYNLELIHVTDSMEQELLAWDQETGEEPQTRIPVVTVLGHVDHGKTSLLDAIRHANVTAGEVGGITQHIGAYSVDIKGKKIVFLDTPGHEAFTAMRARGAQVTDIAILVVAADDGVMPQTVEAVNHVRAAGVPMIVAVNKIDKPNANPERVKQQLSEHDLVPEDWGGDTIYVPVSAVKKEGIDELLEMILLLSEVSELKASPDRPAKGTVIEAKLDRGRGPVATVLVQDGTLSVSDSIICGSISGKVRAMIDDKGMRLQAAGPSTPVEILGLAEVPLAGDKFQVVSDDRLARQLAQKRSLKIREALQRTQRISLEDLFKQIQEGDIKELNLIIKGDVQGSVEALQEALLKLSLKEVKIKVIHTGVGSITESDVMLASASNAIVIGFTVRPEPNARKLAEREKVNLRLYRVIYEAIEDVKKAVAGLLDPQFKEIIIGQAEIRQVFKVSRLGNIAGSYVNEGKITRSAMVRVIRDGTVVHEGRLASLKRFKDDVREVLTGYECGIMLDNFHDLHEGDVIEAYSIEEIKA